MPIILRTIILTGAVCAGAAALMGLGACVPERQQETRGLPPVAVETAQLVPTRIERTIQVAGTILANESVRIKPEVPGKITAIGFAEGEQVVRGSMLFKLDTQLVEAEYREVTADLEFARVQYQRARDLKKSRVMPEERYDEIYRGYINAQARSDYLATRIQKHTLTAPFDGIVGVRRVSMGDYVAVGDELVTLDDIAIVNAEFYVPERYHDQLSDGMSVSVRVDALGEARRGAVYLVSPRLDADTRTLIVRARLDNGDGRLKPGMFCKVQLVLDVRENALVVPREAVVSRAERQYVFVYTGGAADMRQVTLGISSGDVVEAATGLTAGEEIVVVGADKIIPGVQLVKIPPQEAAAGQPRPH